MDIRWTNSLRCSPYSTGNANYYIGRTTGNVNICDKSSPVVFQESAVNVDEKGKYSIFDVANWFLAQESMTHKKLQKLCYYAQAWCYTLNNFRLVDADFQAWIHGPVSPVLYDRFKKYGFDTIKISNYHCTIQPEDIGLLNDVWDTYGCKTGNALEALSHTETPWIEARKGYNSNECCTKAISLDAMKEYYKTIYLGC